jgi:uncharacterized protein YbaR (Trm112 family)
MVSQSLRDPITTPTKTESAFAIAFNLSKGVFYSGIGKNSTVMDKKLLDILCCPSSKQSLHLLSSIQLENLNKAISEQTVQQLDGQKLTAPLKQALITKDQKIIYRIDDGIPVLLSEEGISTATLMGFII